MRWIVLVLSMALVAVGAARAQQPFQTFKGDSLDTPAGRLTVRKEANRVCQPLDTCSVVRLGQSILGKDWSARLLGAYPTADNPAMVFYYTHGGGNCCLPSVAVVDVATKPFFQLGDLFIQTDQHGPTVAEVAAGVFELAGDNYERDKLGDPITTTYLYDRQRRLVWEKPEPGMRDLSPLIGKYPQDLLADSESRGPLVHVIGEASFREFRDHIGVASPMTLLGRRWLVGHGCLPHSCTFQEGYYAIDLRTGKVVALQFDIDIGGRVPRPQVKIWSDVDPATTASLIGLRANIDEWLKPTGAKLRSEPGPFRVNNLRNPSNDSPPAPRESPSSSNPDKEAIATATAPADGTTNRTATSVGPSFDCGAKAVATQPLAQMICSNRELAYFELAYVIAYQALRESLDADGRKTMVAEANALVMALTDQCSIPQKGALQRPPSAQEVGCIKGLFQQERRSLIDRVTGTAREEAVLEPAESIAIQQALQAKQYLASTATIDGVFGPMTRAAIRSWQQSSGLPESGFGSKAMLLQLNRGTAPPPPTSISSGLRREVQMIRVGGTYGVSVRINDAVTLTFVLDSGASDVSVSADVFGTLVRTGTITREDILGTQTYSLADGSVKTSPTFRIRSLNVGPITVKNVKGSVTEDSAPLLLGMSFLGRFQSWSVDNERHVLVLQ